MTWVLLVVIMHTMTGQIVTVEHEFDTLKACDKAGRIYQINREFVVANYSCVPKGDYTP